jgi:hypothetical protein
LPLVPYACVKQYSTRTVTTFITSSRTTTTEEINTIPKVTKIEKKTETEYKLRTNVILINAMSNRKKRDIATYPQVLPL